MVKQFRNVIVIKKDVIVIKNLRKIKYCSKVVHKYTQKMYTRIGNLRRMFGDRLYWNNEITVINGHLTGEDQCLPPTIMIPIVITELYYYIINPAVNLLVQFCLLPK